MLTMPKEQSAAISIGNPAEMSTLAEYSAEMEKLRAELTSRSKQLISPEQLSALQSRLERLHAQELLQQDEFFALEDLCADFLETQTAAGGLLTHEIVYSAPAFADVAKLAKLIGVSEGIDSDTSFARQAKRKFV
eukprot:COSAG02_NODE_2342_length_9101_cov_78.830038_3_plen_135_part_00